MFLLLPAIIIFIIVATQTSEISQRNEDLKSSKFVHIIITSVVISIIVLGIFFSEFYLNMPEPIFQIITFIFFLFVFPLIVNARLIKWLYKNTN